MKPTSSSSRRWKVGRVNATEKRATVGRMAEGMHSTSDSFPISQTTDPRASAGVRFFSTANYERGLIKRAKVELKGLPRGCDSAPGFLAPLGLRHPGL